MLSNATLLDASVSDASPTMTQPPPAPVKPHHRPLPLRVGTRASPLALTQTRAFLNMLTRFCPVLRGMEAFQEHAISTTGDQVLDRRLAEIGGKGLFAKEIHEALLDRRIDLAVHSLKDLDTVLPPGIVIGCVLTREDARDALIVGQDAPEPDPADPYASLAYGAIIGTSSVRRQSQLLHARPDLRIRLLRGNVLSRLNKIHAGDCDATLLALAGMRRLGLEAEASVVLDPDLMVPSAGQGIVGVTVRESDSELRQLLSAIEDPEASAVAAAERGMLAVLDGSCRTPIGGYARIGPDGRLTLTGLVAREDGSFLLKRDLSGCASDALAIGEALGASLRADSPSDVFV